jgi:hypothetical protein
VHYIVTIKGTLMLTIIPIAGMTTPQLQQMSAMMGNDVTLTIPLIKSNYDKPKDTM